MTVSFNFAALKRTKWYEFAIRFVCGGLITVMAGVVAKHFGPAIGGLFLAFPAIFPASATLVEKHERAKKQKAGIQDTSRGRASAALDARGAALGAFGLAFFAAIVWRSMPWWNSLLVLLLAAAGWLVVSVALWRLRKTFLFRFFLR
jgi:hypothetical protein